MNPLRGLTRVELIVFTIILPLRGKEELFDNLKQMDLK